MNSYKDLHRKNSDVSVFLHDWLVCTELGICCLFSIVDRTYGFLPFSRGACNSL